MLLPCTKGQVGLILCLQYSKIDFKNTMGPVWSPGAKEEPQCKNEF